MMLGPTHIKYAVRYSPHVTTACCCGLCQLHNINF